MHDNRTQDVIVVADAAAQVSPYAELDRNAPRFDWKPGNILGLTVTERPQVFLPHTASI